jgi:hypothetical protein
MQQKDYYRAKKLRPGIKRDSKNPHRKEEQNRGECLTDDKEE